MLYNIMKQGYRKINTKRGIYFVAWRPEDVTQLLIDEKLAPADLLTSESRETHHLIRDLYLLACAGTLNGRHRNSMGMLTRYARKLRSSLYTRQ